jgi:iron(III) transport system substrate-binding protein
MAKNSKNPANAVKFLEYLASADAQNYFANGNNEWPTAKGVKTNNPALNSMTNGADFKSETIPVGTVGAHQGKVQQMLDRVGFK